MNVKEIRLGDLFVISNSKGVNANQVEFGGSYPYVTRTEKNNGIAGYIYADDLDKINPENTISFGQDTWTLFYQSEPYFTGNRVKVLKLKDENFKLTEEVALYLITAMKKVLIGLTWGTSKNEVNFENRTICLPVTSSGEIDWQYMQERIVELEHYLVASGLNDYELTEEDKSILATELFNSDDATELPSENSCRKEARKFRVVDLFEVKTPVKKFNASSIEITDKIGHPYVVRSSTNNGIRGYINEDEKYLNEGNTFSFGQDTATIFWQEKPFFTGDKIKILKPKFTCNSEIANYIMNVIAMAFCYFSWGTQSFKVSVIEDAELLLPIQTDTDNNPIIDPENTYHPEGYIPDWSFMENYIRAVEKVVIKDVVDWKDEEIKKTKEIVS